MARRIPKSQFRKEITREQYYTSAMIAAPLQMFDCCPMSDGAAAMVLCSKNVIKKLTNKPVQIAGVGQASSGGLSYSERLYSRPIAREISVQKAYKMAGMTPKDINVVELHDCFTIAEIVATEGLGFFDFGQGRLSAWRKARPQLPAGSQLIPPAV